MKNEQLSITMADNQHAALLTHLSVTTFCESFSQYNRPEDMDKYLADEMNEEKLLGELLDADNLFFLAWYNDVPAGYAKMRANHTPEELKNAHPLEIERIYVLQQYHGQKIGATLMDHCISYALSNAYDPIWLGVWEHNEKAINFYKRWGFELFGSHIFRLGDDDQTDVLMKKYLSK